MIPASFIRVSCLEQLIRWFVAYRSDPEVVHPSSLDAQQVLVTKHWSRKSVDFETRITTQTDGWLLFERSSFPGRRSRLHSAGRDQLRFRIRRRWSSGLTSRSAYIPEMFQDTIPCECPGQISKIKWAMRKIGPRASMIFLGGLDIVSQYLTNSHCFRFSKLR